MKYILNSAVITSPGLYRYRHITSAEAGDWAAGGFVSTVGYAQTAEALSELLGLPVGVNKVTIQMGVGDEALVFRLAFPPGSPRIDPGDKGKLAAAVMAGHFELGLLVREA